MNMTENKIVENNGSSIVLYTTDDGKTQLVITRHIRNIFKEGELDENITCAKFAHMGTDQDQKL